jgi:hypothetical protein
MKASQVIVQGKVTAATGTAVTITPGVDTMDKAASGAITTLVINGTGLTGYAVGDPLTVRISG